MWRSGRQHRSRRIRGGPPHSLQRAFLAPEPWSIDRPPVSPVQRADESSARGSLSGHPIASLLSELDLDRCGSTRRNPRFDLEGGRSRC